MVWGTCLGVKALVSMYTNGFVQLATSVRVFVCVYGRCQCMPLFVTWVSACADRLNFENRYTPLRMAMLGTPRGILSLCNQFHLSLVQPEPPTQDPGSPTIQKVSLQRVLCSSLSITRDCSVMEQTFSLSSLSLCFQLSVQHLSKTPSATFCCAQVTWCWRTRTGHFRIC